MRYVNIASEVRNMGRGWVMFFALFILLINIIWAGTAHRLIERIEKLERKDYEIQTDLSRLQEKVIKLHY